MIDDNNSKIIGIFTVKGIKYKSQAIINCIQNIELNDNQYIPDEEVKKEELMHRVVAEVYNCNITHYYLMSSKKLPLCYLSVIFEIPMQRVLLFRIYINFTIESEILKVEDLLNKNINGKFTMDLVFDDKIRLPVVKVLK